MTDELENISGIIAGTARTEYVMANEGSLNKKSERDMGTFKYMNGIVRSGDAECEVKPYSPHSPYTYKYIINLDDKPVDWDQVFAFDPKLRVTKGMYMIKYVPKGCSDRKKGRPWKIGQDLIRWDIRVSGPRHWMKLVETVPELAWLHRNSTFNLRLFDIAAQHPGMTFWFSLDWVRYEDLIRSQESDIAAPFVSQKVSAADCINIYSKKDKDQDKTILLRGFNDILKEINRAERDKTVLEEMRTVVGEEYVRGRNDSRDPVTGQFIKKSEKKED